MTRLMFIIFFFAAMLVALLRPASAAAHAFPIAEQPRVGSTVSTSPANVAITFDSPIESLFAQLGVAGDSGQDEAAGAPSVSVDRRALSVALKPLEPGDYTVTWSVVAEDGHRSEGSFQFTVAAASR